MPRSSRRSAPAPARSAPAPTRTAATPAPQQHHARSGVPATTNAAPHSVPAQQQAHHAQVPATVPQSQGPGIFGQIAANAASIAAGSTIARGMSHAMGWDGHSQQAAPAPADPQSVNPPVSPYAADFQQDSNQNGQQCELFATDFRDCLAATKGDPSPCQYYLDKFRACQANMTA